MSMNGEKPACGANGEEEKKATFDRECQSLMQEVEALSTDCGVDACAIVFSPFEGDEPSVWPSRDGAMDMISRFQRLHRAGILTASELEALSEEDDDMIEGEEIEMEVEANDPEKEMTEIGFDGQTENGDPKELSNGKVGELAERVECQLNIINEPLAAAGSTPPAGETPSADEETGEPAENGGDKAEGDAAAT